MPLALHCLFKSASSWCLHKTVYLISGEKKKKKHLIILFQIFEIKYIFLPINNSYWIFLQEFSRALRKKSTSSKNTFSSMPLSQHFQWQCVYICAVEYKTLLTPFLHINLQTRIFHYIGFFVVSIVECYFCMSLAK